MKKEYSLRKIRFHHKAIPLTKQERLLFDLVNDGRKEAGLPPLRLDSRLTRLARIKSRDMIKHSYFAHQSPAYGHAGDMLRKAGIRFSLVAENISSGQPAKFAMRAFMGSSGHRNHILDPRYTHTGIGIKYHHRRGYLTTQIFLKPVK